MATTLDDAVKDAVKENPVSTENTETQVENKETSTETKETTNTEEQPRPYQYNEEEQQAINLYRALKDPEIGRSVAFELAKKAGVLGATEGKTTEQITKATVEVLKEGVPPEYHFFVDGLAKGIEKVIQTEVDKRIAPIRQTTNEQLEKTVKLQVDAEFEKFYSKHKDAAKYDDAMKDISKRLPMGEGVELSTYLEDLYKLASLEDKETRTVQETVGKITRNAKEVRETSNGASPTEVKLGSKLPSLDESLRAAARGERFI